MTALKLVVFDVDGTLVDSQGDILSSMRVAFESAGQPVPSREDILQIVGLSLPKALAQLAPEVPHDQLDQMVETYKDTYATLRAKGGADSSPLYPGIRDVLETLQARDEWLLGVATGKSRRGLNALLDSLDLRSYFVTTQVADDHPSKPNPAMLLAALSETGVAIKNSVMIGDTSFDMDMAQNAGMASVAVGWGYHPADQLKSAQAMVSDVSGLIGAIDKVLGDTP